MGSAQITWERQQPFARLVQNLGEVLRLTSPFLEFWLIDLHVCIYQYVLYMFLYVNMLFFTWSELVWSGYFATHRTKFVTFGSSHIFGETQIPVYIYIYMHIYMWFTSITHFLILKYYVSFVDSYDHDDWLLKSMMFPWTQWRSRPAPVAMQIYLGPTSRNTNPVLLNSSKTGPSTTHSPRKIF